jgi:hypothetical protein
MMGFATAQPILRAAAAPLSAEMNRRLPMSITIDRPD